MRPLRRNFRHEPALCGVLLLLTLLFAAREAGAQAQTSQAPPSFEEVAGHAFGERITQHHETVRYLERLAEASPRVAMRVQGESWEGRPLVLAIVTSPENHARLDEIQRTAQRLGDPRQTPANQAQALIENQPAIVWLGGSIHGFELSGTEGLLKLLEHLATRTDSTTQQVLRNTVVLIDPTLNPDGRDAFAQENHERIGRTPNPSRSDWNNDYSSFEALKYRTGHYYFDTNRDWFAHTQPETRARAATMQAWRPQVVVDAHEMSPDVEFFFDPPAPPYGAYYPELAKRWYTEFGDAYAAAFDTAGFEYMTRERYNYLYPGYTGAYGSYQGAVGMLYEQGSTRGLAIERADETVRTLADALEQQYVAAWAAARLAAEKRQRLLREYYQAHQSAIEEGRQGNRRYLIPPDGDPNHVAELVNLLMRSGVDIQRLTGPATLQNVQDRTGQSVGSRTFPAGSYVVDAAQPRSRFIRTLLEPEVAIEEDFLAVARERVDRDENPRFYDITAWSLPLMFNVGGYATPDGASLQAEAVTEPVRSSVPPPEQASYAYLIDGRQAASLAALYHLKDQGYRAAVITEPTRVEGAEVSSGTVIVRVGQNDEGVHEAVRALAERYALDVRAVSTGQAAEGFPALGSGDVTIQVKTPRIALVAEDPIQAYSFGWAWHALDQAYQIPATILRTRSLHDMDLSDFNVLVLPEVYDTTQFKQVLDSTGLQRVREWVRDGGTLVAIGEAVDAARGPLGLIALRSWYDQEEREEAQRFFVPGAFFRTVLDGQDWLAAGYADSTLPALVFSERLYQAPEGSPDAEQRTVAHIAEDGPVRLAGYAWKETMERIPGAVFLYEERVGEGRVIAFAEDPNFRGYWRGADRLFLNAVVLGPSAP